MQVGDEDVYRLDADLFFLHEDTGDRLHMVSLNVNILSLSLCSVLVVCLMLAN